MKQFVSVKSNNGSEHNRIIAIYLCERCRHTVNLPFPPHTILSVEWGDSRAPRAVYSLPFFCIHHSPCHIFLLSLPFSFSLPFVVSTKPRGNFIAAQNYPYYDLSPRNLRGENAEKARHVAKCKLTSSLNARRQSEFGNFALFSFSWENGAFFIDWGKSWEKWCKIFSHCWISDEYNLKWKRRRNSVGSERELF